MIGKIINKVINPFGFKIERTVESNSPSDADGYAEYSSWVPTSKIEFQHIGLIKHHNLNVDILRYSDKKELTDIFINKLASREYQVIERKCVVCGGG